MDNIKHYLLIQTYSELSKYDDPLKGNLICRFLVFNESNPEYKNLLKYYKNYIYEISLHQYNIIKKYNVYKDFSNLSKKDFFIQNNIEEFLV